MVERIKERHRGDYPPLSLSVRSTRTNDEQIVEKLVKKVRRSKDERAGGGRE